MQTLDISFKRHRFPLQIVSHAVWLYLRFNLSLREVEETLLERGIDVSYETVRHWTAKYGPRIARNLRRQQARPGDVWYLDEVVVKCSGEKFWLWRAVDQHGTVLEEILQKRRDKRAAKRLLVALMKRYGFVPKRIITDKLRFYGAAKADVAPGLYHWSHKGLNNWAENSHQPFRKRERIMQGHRSLGALQRFVSMHSATRNCFSVSSRCRAAQTIRYHRLEAFDAWKIAARSRPLGSMRYGSATVCSCWAATRLIATSFPSHCREAPSMCMTSKNDWWCRFGFTGSRSSIARGFVAGVKGKLLRRAVYAIYPKAPCTEVCNSHLK